MVSWQRECRWMVSVGTWCPTRTRRCSSIVWTSTRTWTNLWHTTTSAPHTTPTSPVDSSAESRPSKCTVKSCWLVAGNVYSAASWTLTEIDRPIVYLFTLLLVHLILRISHHHSHHLRSHHLPLPWSFTPDSKLISFTNPFLHSLSGSFWAVSTDLEPVPNIVGHLHLFLFQFPRYIYIFLFLVTCARLSWLR